MNNQSIRLQRTKIILNPDQSRVLLRPFKPGDAQRVSSIIARVMTIPEQQVGHLLEEVTAEFSKRHRQVHRRCLERFEQVRGEHLPKGKLSEQRRLLIGAYFLAEYSLESAALFNPSIVPHPDQAGTEEGTLRFILSLRATGEGHVSSITFRTGVIHDDHRIEIQDPGGFITKPARFPIQSTKKVCSPASCMSWDWIATSAAKFLSDSKKLLTCKS